MKKRELVVAGMKCMKNMMRETCRDFLRITSAQALPSSVVPLPGNLDPIPINGVPLPINAVPLPGNIGSRDSSEEESEELISSFPGLHKPFPLPGNIFPFPAVRPPPYAAPENVQQVSVEMPESHLPNIGEIFPEKWPENLVAAFVPADWLAEHVDFRKDDDYDDYEYDTDQEDEEEDEDGETESIPTVDEDYYYY